MLATKSRCMRSSVKTILHSPRRAPGVCRAGNTDPDAARPVMLSSGAVWLLNEVEDRYYHIRGDGFVVQRAEQRDNTARKHHTRASSSKYPRQHPVSDKPATPAPIQVFDPMAALQQAMWANPASTMFITDGPVIDIPHECVEVMPAQSITSLVRVPVIGPEQLGIIAVSNPEGEDLQEGDADIFVTGTSSPRRTKMVRFKCCANGCGAVNIKPMNPLAFNKGTALAECAKCSVWHLVRDHLGLFSQLKGRLFFQASTISESDIPESLRKPRPSPGITSGGYSILGGSGSHNTVNWILPDDFNNSDTDKSDS